MKYIITESQYNKLWLLRRYDLVKESFNVVSSYMDPCIFNSFDLFERIFLHNMMDDLHQYYYEINDFDYNGTMEVLGDMFYVDITEMYYNRECK